MSKGLGYVPLDPLVHSVAWVKREREHREQLDEARRVYNTVWTSIRLTTHSTLHDCPSCRCADALSGKQEEK